eukprot:gene25505-biopygen18009
MAVGLLSQASGHHPHHQRAAACPQRFTGSHNVQWPMRFLRQAFASAGAKWRRKNERIAAPHAPPGVKMMQSSAILFRSTITALDPPENYNSCKLVVDGVLVGESKSVLTTGLATLLSNHKGCGMKRSDGRGGWVPVAPASFGRPPQQVR